MGKTLSGFALGLALGAVLLGWFPVIGWLIFVAGLVVTIIAIAKAKKQEDGKKMAMTAALIMGITLIMGIAFTTVGSIAYFGILSPGGLLPTKCKMDRPFACMNVELLGENGTINFQNNAGYPLSRVDMTFSGDCSDTVAAGRMAASGWKTVTFCQDGIGGIGENAYIDVAIVYVQSGGTITHTSHGTIRAMVK